MHDEGRFQFQEKYLKHKHMKWKNSWVWTTLKLEIEWCKVSKTDTTLFSDIWGEQEIKNEETYRAACYLFSKWYEHWQWWQTHLLLCELPNNCVLKVKKSVGFTTKISSHFSFRVYTQSGKRKMHYNKMWQLYTENFLLILFMNPIINANIHYRLVMCIHLFIVS
jgi:hypothetical protein